MDAIERAFEIAAPYTSMSITIYMFTDGDHYLVRAARAFYLPLSVDRDSQNLALTIMPLYCSDVPTASTPYCTTYDASVKPVTLYNKIRGQFVIPIS
jgi:hypothetical protein